MIAPSSSGFHFAHVFERRTLPDRVETREELQSEAFDLHVTSRLTRHVSTNIAAIDFQKVSCALSELDTCLQAVAVADHGADQSLILNAQWVDGRPAHYTFDSDEESQHGCELSALKLLLLRRMLEFSIAFSNSAVEVMHGVPADFAITFEWGSESLGPDAGYDPIIDPMFDALCQKLGVSRELVLDELGPPT